MPCDSSARRFDDAYFLEPDDRAPDEGPIVREGGECNSHTNFDGGIAAAAEGVRSVQAATGGGGECPDGEAADAGRTPGVCCGRMLVERQKGREEGRDCDEVAVGLAENEGDAVNGPTANPSSVKRVRRGGV